MELRTRILPKMLNSEVEEYLQHNDVIFVPVGTVEMHGGFPLDCETILSEAFALEMAEACDGLVLTGLPYFYAGATASGRGTTQVSVRQGVDYLSGIAHSLLRQGFKRQIYLSYHGPAHMTCCAMVRDFFDETGVPILYIDLVQHNMKPEQAKTLADFLRHFDCLYLGGYKKMGRLEDVPCTDAFAQIKPQSCTRFNDLFGLAYQSGAVGYCFAENSDHACTTAIPDETVREQMADEGLAELRRIVAEIDPAHVVEQLRALEKYTGEVEKTHPWMPSAYNRKKED